MWQRGHNYYARESIEKIQTDLEETKKLMCLYTDYFYSNIIT